MNIGFIGAGKVGCSFGCYLRQENLPIKGYYSRNKSSAEIGAKLTNSSVLNFYELISKCDFIFITTPDDEIGGVWNKMLKYDLKDKKIFHMSGASSVNLFNGYEEKGAFTYSLHPIYSFSERDNSNLEETIFSLEGKNIEEISSFLKESKIKYFKIGSREKVKYHSALVFVSNYLVSLFKISEELLIDCGMDKDFVLKCILPLAYSSLRNIEKNGINHSLTGPISRGDVDIIRKHLIFLGDYINVYRELALVALKITEVNGILEDKKLEKIKRILIDNR